MTPHSLHIIHASLQSFPVAVSISSTLRLAARPPQKVYTTKETGDAVPLDVRATKMTSLLAHIHGYEHGGLND